MMETNQSPMESKKPEDKARVRDNAEINSDAIAAIQGKSDVYEYLHRTIAKVREISPQEEIASGFKVLDSSAEYDLDIAAQFAAADKAVQYHETKIKGRVCEYRRIRAGITEILAAQNIPGGIRCDPYSISGTNFPNYDVLSHDEFASVKALSLKDGEPRRIYRQYFSDVVNPDSKKNQQAVERLMWLRENDEKSWQELSSRLPPEMNEVMDIQTMQKALAQRATLRIPDDQIESVKEDLKKYFLKYPEKINLHEENSPEKYDQIITQYVESRLRSIDERYTTAHFQAKGAEMVSLRDEDLARLASRS